MHPLASGERAHEPYTNINIQHRTNFRVIRNEVSRTQFWQLGNFKLRERAVSKVWKELTNLKEQSRGKSIHGHQYARMVEERKNS